MIIHSDLLITELILSEEFRNKQSNCPVYKIEAPDGQSILLRQNLSKGCKLRQMLIHLGANIEDLSEPREVRGLCIGGIELKQIDLNRLQFQSKDKRDAVDIYLTILKPELNNMGYDIIGHNCYPYKLKKTEPDCLNATLNAHHTHTNS